MGDNNYEISSNNVVVAQPVASDQNELVMQLMQQIAEIRVECKECEICLIQFSLTTLHEMKDLHSTFHLQV